jgi:hypothetical protein
VASVSSLGRDLRRLRESAFSMIWSVDRPPLGKRWAGIDGSVLQDGRREVRGAASHPRPHHFGLHVGTLVLCGGFADRGLYSVSLNLTPSDWQPTVQSCAVVFRQLRTTYEFEISSKSIRVRKFADLKRSSKKSGLSSRQVYKEGLSAMSAKARLSADKRTSGARTEAPPFYGYAAQGDARRSQSPIKPARQQYRECRPRRRQAGSHCSACRPNAAVAAGVRHRRRPDPCH